MTQQQTPFYFSSAKDGGHYSLVQQRGDKGAAVTETVDLADRSTLNGMHYYPRPIIEAKLEDDGPVTEMVYASKPFVKPQTISGAFTGELDVTLNKKDADLAVAVFEQLADGRLFHLGYWLGRASYAGHPEKRVLLTPGKLVRIAKTLIAFMRRADEGTLSRLMVEAAILLAASRHNGTNVLKEAATLYKVDTEAVGQKVKQEFAAKARAKKEPKPVAKPAPKVKKEA